MTPTNDVVVVTFPFPVIKPQQGGSYNAVYNSGSFVAIVVYWLAERNVPEANRKVNAMASSTMLKETLRALTKWIVLV